MELALHTLKPAKGSKKNRKRVGRGLASTGSYSGRGVKGQRARSGGRSGLQKKGLRPILLNIPKSRGFTSLQGKASVVNIELLNKIFPDGTFINPKILVEKGLVPKGTKKIKILGTGNLHIKLHIENCAVSSSAKEKIESVGGSVK